MVCLISQGSSNLSRHAVCEGEVSKYKKKKKKRRKKDQSINKRKGHKA